MNPDLNKVLDAALKLPPDQQQELIKELRGRGFPMGKRRGDVRKFFGTFDSGDPNSADNEKIDSDLAEAYADDHEPEN
jgi:hypothetical protein